MNNVHSTSKNRTYFAWRLIDCSTVKLKGFAFDKKKKNMNIELSVGKSRTWHVTDEKKL